MRTKDRINILMVDDSATNLLALESILQGPDRNLVRASSGEDALRYLLSNDVAVILMDVYMPGLDGLETAELIRGRDRSRSIPIIFLTADSTGGRHLSRGYSLGAVDYIVKPVEPDILRTKVAVFVELYKKTQEVQAQAELLKQKNRELESANLTRLNMLIRLGQELAAEHEPDRVLGNFCRSAREIVGAEEAAVGILNGHNDDLKHFFRCSPNDWKGESEPIPGVVAHSLKTIMRKRRSLRLSETDRILEDPKNVSVRSFLGAPLFSAAKVCGWLYLLNKVDGDEFTEADESLASTLATQVAIAYENATLYHHVQSHAEELQSEISERKLAEEERAKLFVLEQEARAEAEKANRTKDEFLATLSHELRTPLTAILGWSHLMRTGNLDDPQLGRAVDTIERNARAQSQLIDDLLDVSRIITGKLKIEPHRVDVCAVVTAAVEAARPTFEAKSIEFELDMEAQGCFVAGDSNRLQQVFWNLFSNAVKFTPENGRVTVKARRNDDHINIAITDTGIGIDPQFVPYIFDRFRQADGSTTRLHGGLGLGLAIVKHLVLLHKGTVEVESPGEDQGSTFIVSLPIAREGDQVSAEVQPNGSEGRLTEYATLLDGLRILVVDDDADSRDVVEAILNSCGSEVTCCKSAAEAIKAVRDWKPDLMVSDIGMPLEDGFDLIDKLRKHRSKRARLMPAIALTAYATKDDKARTLAAGFQAHVTKPVEPEVLVKSIASAMGRIR
jgi:signal transduction histidine kinase/DNA-binding response OmpR family regulator